MISDDDGGDFDCNCSLGAIGTGRDGWCLRTGGYAHFGLKTPNSGLEG